MLIPEHGDPIEMTRQEIKDLYAEEPQEPAEEEAEIEEERRRTGLGDVVGDLLSGLGTSLKHLRLRRAQKFDQEGQFHMFSGIVCT